MSHSDESWQSVLTPVRNLNDAVASDVKVGFKGAKRSTSFAAQTCGQRCAEDSVEKGVPAVRVLLKGLGAGRQTAVKGLQMGGLEIVSVTDTTPIPHNGCRPKKARRI